MTCTILGLDPGIAIVGFGIINCQRENSLNLTGSIKNSRQIATNFSPIQLIDFGIIETPAKTDITKRLLTIYQDLHEIIDAFQPDLVAIEKLFFYRMGNTISVAQARGILLLVLGEKNLSYIEFTPPEIKQTLTGYGKADKTEVQEAVARELNLDYLPKPDDAADGLAVALTAWHNQ